MNSRDLPKTSPHAPRDTGELATFGLPKPLHPIANWAHKIGLDPILIAVLDATKTDRFTDYIGTIVRFLRQQETSNLLANWASELPSAGELCRLSEAFSVSPFIASEYQGMPSLKLVSHQLTGGLLTKLAAVALIARPIPALAQSDRQWIAALRTWVFLQIVDSVFRGGRPNHYLLEVTNKLRLAIDRNEQWLTLFARLHGPTTSFHGMTRYLASACSQLLADQTARVESSVHRQLLSTLKNFCEGKTSQTDDEDSSEVHGRFQAFLTQQPRQNPPSFFLPLIQDDSRLPVDFTQTEDADDRGLTLNFDPPGADESTLTVTAVEQALTPPEQEHQARGILLSTAQDHQFLTYSWNRPSPPELLRLKGWLAAALVGNDLALQTLASFVEIALLSANSLETVLPLRISGITEADWSCDIKHGSLHRISPRRYNGWQVTPDSAAWVAPLTAASQVALAPAAARTLRQLLAGAPASTQIENLWPASIGETPATMFNRICRETKGMERLRSGMLAQVLEQHVFAITADPTLSELMASHQNSGLGGACAYASYKHAQIHSLFAQTTSNSAASPPDPADPEANAAGSELSPLDAALRQACSRALAKVNELSTQPEQWISHHNALTAYVVVVLLAATAARPVSSPFESLDHFDWSTLTVYIEDKVSSRLHQGRLVPIPQWVASLVEDCYLPHLVRLSEMVSQIDPPLSEEVKSHSRSMSSKKLPLFFLLGMAPQLRWFAVSESTLSALEVFSWPLPWNLMRHRLPTKLKRMGQDHECINGMTGHGEHGTAAYGPYSMRIWQDDAQQLRLSLTEALAGLDLKTPTAPQWAVRPAQSVGGASATSCLATGAPFGSAARASRRQASHQQAAQQAREEILQFVNGRAIDSLTPDQWETLSRKMLLHGDGRPRTLGTIRYETLQLWVSENWQDHGIRPRIKRRYLPSLEEKSPFTLNAIGCQKRIDQALQVALGITRSMEPSRTSRRESLALGIMLLVLQSRIAEPSVLKDLLQGKDFRLVLFQRRYHLEHSPGLDKVPDAPVRRFGISTTAAVLLARAKASANMLDVRQWPRAHGESVDGPAGDGLIKDGLRDIWNPVARHESPFTSFQDCVLDVAAHVGQANAMQYPGIVAGYLNGDVVSAGLGHADWVRVTLNKAAIPVLLTVTKLGVKNADSHDEDVNENIAPSELVDTTYVPSPDAFMKFGHEYIAATSGVSELQQNSFRFFKKIRDALNNELTKKVTSRRVLDSKLRVLISENKAAVSRTCLLLGEWLRSLLWRKTKQGLIRIRSLTRYLNALSTCFQAMAYDHDLTGCDDDEVTEFYRRVMEVRQLVHPGHATDANALASKVKPAETENEDEVAARRYRSQSLALQLLRDFHRLVSREFGVEDPDWSEISIADDLLSISPGLMTEAEYLLALRALAPAPAQSSREQLARAFILLTAFRFGLRGDEATGLLRSDWVDDQPDALVVLVRGNHFRRLKTPAAQRQIPMLFLFTDQEKEVLTSWLASFDGITTLDGAGPLFAETQCPDRLMNVQQLRRQVSQVIKQVTCNPDSSLHHARHTFANRVVPLLVEGAGDLWPNAAAPEQSSKERKSHVRRLLLGTDQVTRRSLWALARLLGHAHPTTTVRSYLHLLPDLAMHYVNLPVPAKRPVSQDLSNVCINLDDLSFREDYLQPVSEKCETAPPPLLTPNQALRFLLLCQRGVSVARAQVITRISTRDADRLIQGVKAVDSILARRPHINPSAGGPYNFLGHISQGRWAELIARSHDVVWMASTEDKFTIHFTELPMMIGGSRQILLWKPIHFTFFKAVVDSWKLGEESYLVHMTQRKRDILLAMATGANLGLGKEPQAQLDTANANSSESKPVKSGPKRETTFQQIDPVILDDPTLVVGPRCGVLAQTHPTSALRSSHELALLVLVGLALQDQESIQAGNDLNGSSGT